MTNANFATTNTATEAEESVEERLAKIAAAVAAATSSIENAVKESNAVNVNACPVDPAERALCDSCQ